MSVPGGWAVGLPTSGSATVEVRLVGGPLVSVDGRPALVPEGCKRLLALVALHRRRVQRGVASRLLWPDVPTARAAGNLRSAIWRLRGAGVDVLGADPTWLVLDTDVRVDVEEVLAGPGEDRSADACEGLLPDALAALDLLPGWYEEWVQTERDRLREQLLGQIETMATTLIRAGRSADAIEAALTMVALDPLRESAQTVLIGAHLGEGNVGEARRAFRGYARLLAEELGTVPSEPLLRLVGARRVPQDVRRTPTAARAGHAGRPGNSSTIRRDGSTPSSARISLAYSS